MRPCAPNHDPGMMEDFIERSLRERRSLQGALADMLSKYDSIPFGSERTMLERMIAVLKEEIARRAGQTACRELNRRCSQLISFSP